MSAIPLETLQARLEQARNAYHKLMTGTMARVVVDVDGSRVEFSATNRQQLYAYIQSLEAKVCPSPPPQAGPLGFYF